MFAPGCDRLSNGRLNINQAIGNVPDYFGPCGMPYKSNGELAVDSTSAIDHWTAGIPRTAAGAIATTGGDPVYWYNNVALSAEGRVSMVAGTPAYFSNGDSYATDGEMTVG